MTQPKLSIMLFTHGQTTNHAGVTVPLTPRQMKARLLELAAQMDHVENMTKDEVQIHLWSHMREAQG